MLLDGPLNGYEVRRRLELMGTQHWANVAYGSIYHGLGKMADEGLLERRRRARAARPSTRSPPVGRAEFGRQLLSHWWEIKPIVDPFQVALTFMDRLTPSELTVRDGGQGRPAPVRHRDDRRACGAKRA